MCPALWENQGQILPLCRTTFQVIEGCYPVSSRSSFLKAKHAQFFLYFLLMGLGFSAPWSSFLPSSELAPVCRYPSQSVDTGLQEMPNQCWIEELVPRRMLGFRAAVKKFLPQFLLLPTHLSTVYLFRGSNCLTFYYSLLLTPLLLPPVMTSLDLEKAAPNNAWASKRVSKAH